MPFLKSHEVKGIGGFEQWPVKDALEVLYCHRLAKAVSPCKLHEVEEGERERKRVRGGREESLR